MTATVRGRRRGAPRKTPDEARTRAITIRVTPAEHDQIFRAATRAGTRTRTREATVARYARDQVLGRPAPVVPAVNRAMWTYLASWAGAFTTIANAAAGARLAGLLPHLDPPLEIALEEIRAELRALRLALLGHDVAEWERDEEATGRDRSDDGDPPEHPPP